MRGKTLLLQFGLYTCAVCVCVVYLLTASTVFAQPSIDPKVLKLDQNDTRTPRLDEDMKTRPEAEADYQDEGRSYLVHGLLYLPNRFFDLLDIFRLRARVGPGFHAGMRVTKYVSLNAGTYGTLYAGLPGPRRRQWPRSPIGLEAYAGLRASVYGIETSEYGPSYSASEIGVGAQLGIAGADVGIDPIEIFDFIGGIFFLDLLDDDF